MSGMSRRLGRCWVLLGFLLLFSLSAGAQTADERARQHFESGVAYLQESDYDNALRAFEKAYELSKRHEILLNIATVHERTGELGKAITALEKFLSLVPDGEHTATVQTRLENLRRREAAKTEATPEPARPVPAPPPAKQESAPAPAPPPPPPPPNRVPALVAFGVGAIAAGGAVVTGIMAQGEYDDAKSSCKTSCSDDELSTGRSLALTSTVLTGVAIIGAGVGAVLWFGADSSQTGDARAPARRLGVRVGPGSAHAVWRF
ncbi:MAG: tetratricopeptide repeat protein [Polyangiaceae bacterium]